MMVIALGGLAGVALVFFRILENRRIKAKIAELIGDVKYECFDYTKPTVIFLALSALLPFSCFVISIFMKDEAMIAISLAFSFLAVAEVLNIILNFKLYYNDNNFILKDKVLRYKSIRAIFKCRGLPLNRHLLHTFNGEQYDIHKQAAQLLSEKAKIPITY